MGLRKRKEMNRLIIIGNGFDLHCKLESSFKDYIKFFLKKYEFIKEIKKSKENLIKLKEIASEVSVWEVLLSVESKKENWYDVESYMQKKLIDEVMYQIRISESEYEDEKGTFFERCYSCDFIKDSQECHMIPQYQLDIVRILFDAYGNKRNDWDYFRMFIKNQTLLFERNFSEYLLGVLRINETYYDEQGNLLEQLISKSKGKMNKILSFNYTDIKLENRRFKITDVQHVHGKLSDENIIIGIDYKNFSSLQTGFLYSKTYRKMNMELNKTKNDILNDIDEIVFYGHSLNEQDYSYFQAIFDRLDIYNKQIKIMFYYSIDHFPEPKSVNGDKDQMDKVSRLIETYGTTFNNKDHGKNLLHKLLLESRLNLVKI